MLLNEILNKMNKEELENIASYLGLSKSDDYKYEISSYLLDISNLRKILYIIPDKIYNTLLSHNTLDIKSLSFLSFYGISFKLDNNYIIPSDLYDLIDKLNTNIELSYRKKESYVYACVEYANLFYCVYPLDILLKLVSQNTSFHMSRTELKARILDLPRAIGLEYISKLDLVININSTYDLKDLLKKQENKPYYIPSYKEIMELFNTSMISSIDYDILLTYKKYFNDNVGEEIKYILFNICATTYKASLDLFDFIYDKNKIKDNDLIKEIKHNLYRIIENTKNVYNRGYSINEVYVRKIN